MTPPEQRLPGSPLFVVPPTAGHTHTILLLHGLGSTGERFGRELLDTAVTSSGKRLTDLLPHARFVFPTSKRRRSTAFGRSMLTQWFDLCRTQDPAYLPDRQLPDLAESASEILAVIRDELSRVPPGNLILGVLSQGCAMALAVLLCLEHPVGGFIGMSGFLTYESGLRMVLAEDDYGDGFDPFFDAERPAREQPGEAAAEVMRAAGYCVDWKRYENQGHWYKIPDQIDDIVNFISRIGWNMKAKDDDM
ncbi:hypothetical protein MY5147_006761 [Beauveria neobassiana]